MLLLTYHFAPDPSVASDRPNSIYKHASANDVDVDVLTARHGSGPPRPSSVIEVDSMQHWTALHELPRKVPYKAFTKLFEPFLLNVDLYWYRNAVQWFKKTRPSPYDIIYAVFPTATAVLLGRALSRISGTPLVTDFTDTIAYAPIYPQNPLQRITQAWLERSLVAHSRCIVTIAKGFENYFRRAYPTSRVTTIYNGYDEEDFSLIDGSRPAVRMGRPVRIAHFGNICASRERDVVPLFEGIARARKRHPTPAEMVFVGRYTPNEMRLAERFGLGSTIQFRPYMDKRLGLKMLHEEFDYLLFYGVPGESAAVCSKLLEYLRVGRPILGICKGNEAEGIISRAGAGEIADFTAHSVATLIGRAFERETHFEPDFEYIQSFDRRRQAADIFAFVEAYR